MGHAGTELGAPAIGGERSEDTFRTLAALLRRDLDFGSSDSGYASHAIHPFAAKFPPQIPRLFIEELTQSGDSVLDPMAGSGTTIVEALMLRREAFGFDIDPLAVRLCTVKTTWLDPVDLQRRCLAIIEDALDMGKSGSHLRRELETRYDAETRKFIDYWFLPETQLELLALVLAIERVSEPAPRGFFELVLSSTIIAKTGGVSMARDLAHSRPHRDPAKNPRNAITEFRLRSAKALKKFQNLPQRVKKVFVAERDARNLPLPTGSIDLVVTSPPYANALDYMRAHKFSLAWLGYPLRALSALRGRYIGSENLHGGPTGELPRRSAAAVRALAERDARKAKVLAKYLGEMRDALAETNRVLKPGKGAVLVVGPSIMRGVPILTHEYLAEIGSSVGFRLAGVQKRRIDRDRRMLPVSLDRNGHSTIEQRMHEEYVVGLVKE